MEEFKYVDSKYRMVILAAKRAKQLINGHKKKLDMKAENPLTIAIAELRKGLVEYEILPPKPEEKSSLEFVDQDSSDSASEIGSS